jgi:RimJ/RimL family protein N-acetyltransferase
MRHDPSNGVVEVGYIAFSPLLRQTPAPTEAQYLLMSYAFDTLGYRALRVEMRQPQRTLP